MKPLIRNEDFKLQNILVSTEHKDYGHPHRVAADAAPWCTIFGYHFGEWAQVDLGKIRLT